MSSESIVDQCVNVQSARTSSLSFFQLPATESVSGISIEVCTGPVAKLALRPSESAPSPWNLVTPSKVTSPLTSCLTFER